MTPDGFRFATAQEAERFRELHRRAEKVLVPEILAYVEANRPSCVKVEQDARQLLRKMRREQSTGVVNQFLAEYGLSSDEGLALLSLAEAYLRVPDAITADALIADKIGTADWASHAGSENPLLVRSATWSLILTKALVSDRDGSGILRRLVARLGEPVIRAAVSRAMALMGNVFVMGRTIEEAIARASRDGSNFFSASFDMLGEAAKTRSDANAYFDSYKDAILRVAEAPREGDSISVKLSALEPRYETAHASSAVTALSERLLELCQEASRRSVGITVDAEEADRLEMSLAIISNVARDPSLSGWDGLGLAIQAYSKRARATIEWVEALGRETRRRLSTRLVKGAYWDTEIKHAQEQGLEDFPVFTRKETTDLNYLACAHSMLAASHIFPAFATHNALTVATIRAWAGGERDFEFQKLHGMGAGLYDEMVAQEGYRCRIYAPVGNHRDLLAYLVRRLLENGANSSFVHQLADRTKSDEEILRDPADKLSLHTNIENDIVTAPADLFMPERKNSRGVDLASQAELLPLCAHVLRYRECGKEFVHAQLSVAEEVELAEKAFSNWRRTSIGYRSDCLKRLADLLESNRDDLIAQLVSEAKKTIPDSLAEVREAVDFCRFYAARAKSLQKETELPGPTGETNVHRYVPRGAWAAISPWNFPLAIFLGQATAALVTGNTVVAKAAPQTPVIARFARKLAIEAGIPEESFRLVEGGAPEGRSLVEDRRIRGVVFTGSTATARAIALSLLADPSRALLPLIAETGGINAMIVDSTALPEQVVRDVLISSFQSAGQRCSALRLLVLQEEIEQDVIEMLQGAMDELELGDPAFPSTDVGPVIDRPAYDRLMTYRASRRSDWIKSVPSGDHPLIVPPTVIRNKTIEQLDREWFGPLLHVTTWKAGELEQTVERINSTGYGLTMGLHSRISDAADTLCQLAEAGNLYVNRSMVGAIVGSQPFGGEGLSGTGPKAGGPNYLQRFCSERVVTVDTTSAGGNAALLAADA